MSIRNSICLPVLLLILFIKPDISSGQQMIVDDATIANTHLLETWAGTEESWIQPIISISRSWNINPGIIFNTSNQQINATNWVIENKFIGSGDRWSYGNVTATVFDFDGRLSQIYSYIPVSRTIFNYNSYIHLNMGLESNHVEEEWSHSLFLGLRGDFSLSSRAILLSEVYSTATDAIGFQGGFRFILIPGRMESDITYGQTFDGEIKYPGFNVGISLAL